MWYVPLRTAMQYERRTYRCITSLYYRGMVLVRTSGPPCRPNQRRGSRYSPACRRQKRTDTREHISLPRIRPRRTATDTSALSRRFLRANLLSPSRRHPFPRPPLPKRFCKLLRQRQLFSGTTLPRQKVHQRLLPFRKKMLQKSSFSNTG
jgi:hypothetical protein